MLKRPIILLFIIFIASIVIAMIVSGIYVKDEFNLTGQFYKKISVAPSGLSIYQDFLQDGNIDNYLEIIGKYSVEYNSNSAQLTTLGESMSIENLRSIQVHLLSDPIFANNMDHDLLNAEKNDTTIVNLIANETLKDFFSIVIMTPLEIDTSYHQGKFSMLNQAGISQNDKIKLGFFDIIEDNDLSCSFQATLLPLNLYEYALFIPMNNYQILMINNTGYTTLSSVFNGSFMRLDNFHFISSYIGFESILKGQATELISPSLEIPCEISIFAESIDSILLSDFYGWYQIENEETIQEIGPKKWEIKNAILSEINIEVTEIDNSKVLIELQFQGKIRELIVNDISIGGFYSHFIENIILIWSNPYLVGIVGSAYTSVVIYWIKGKKIKR